MWSSPNLALKTVWSSPNLALKAVWSRALTLHSENLSKIKVSPVVIKKTHLQAVLVLVLYCCIINNKPYHISILQISNGPTYVLQVSGYGILPGLHFSQSSVNFGPCFIHRAGMPLQTSVVKLTNTDRKEIRYGIWLNAMPSVASLICWIIMNKKLTKKVNYSIFSGHCYACDKK